jgi:hypothetical protein
MDPVANTEATLFVHGKTAIVTHFPQRNEMLAAGFTDNGGAIHSAERILDILGQRLKYPGLSHGNALRHYPKAEFSDAAWVTDGHSLFFFWISASKSNGSVC